MMTTRTWKIPQTSRHQKKLNKKQIPAKKKMKKKKATLTTNPIFQPTARKYQKTENPYYQNLNQDQTTKLTKRAKSLQTLILIMMNPQLKNLAQLNHLQLQKPPLKAFLIERL